ncbi:hypothetical protein A6A06_37795 [Streptomyces sp. CB02923]|nr:hypothetical protein A6A06_37795 [Streptomyces sp. CB02923]
MQCTAGGITGKHKPMTISVTGVEDDQVTVDFAVLEKSTAGDAQGPGGRSREERVTACQSRDGGRLLVGVKAGRVQLVRKIIQDRQDIRRQTLGTWAARKFASHCRTVGGVSSPTPVRRSLTPFAVTICEPACALLLRTPRAFPSHQTPVKTGEDDAAADRVG